MYMKLVRRGVRTVVVLVGVILLTSLTIDATDTLERSQTALGIFATEMTKEVCPSDMATVRIGDDVVCVDRYEVSAGSECPYLIPSDVTQTAVNINDPTCRPQSREGTIPWTAIAQVQAEQLCARVGKRLPTSEEWYKATLGTPDNSTVCNVNGALQKTGESSGCLSGSGLYDAVGNVWEWVSGEVIDGRYGDVVLPPTGYIAAVSTQGMVLETSGDPSVLYNEDYFWAKSDGRFHMMRGGFYGSKTDGGFYTLHAQVEQNFASDAIGLRCAQSL